MQKKTDSNLSGGSFEDNDIGIVGSNTAVSQEGC